MSPDTPPDPFQEDTKPRSRVSLSQAALIGTRLGDTYEITRILGRGGMGRVYEARHLRLPRKAALKVMEPEIAKDPTAYKRFRREAEIASSLGSRNIIEVLDFNVLPDGSPYLLMEYLDGEDLAAAIEREAPFEPRRAAVILEQAVSALAAAHAREIVHRDIKPANMFLSREADGVEVLKLLDFGLCKARLGSRSLTQQSIMGTPCYMSPEQLRDSGLVDARADVYSLGVVLFEMLTGRLPFPNENLLQLAHAVMNSPIPSAVAAVPDLPPAIDAVLSRAMAKDPDQRWSSVLELGAAALPVLRSAPERQRPAPRPPPQERSPPSPTTESSPGPLALTHVTLIPRPWGRIALAFAVTAALTSLGVVKTMGGGKTEGASQPAPAPSMTKEPPPAIAPPSLPAPSAAPTPAPVPPAINAPAEPAPARPLKVEVHEAPTAVAAPRTEPHRRGSSTHKPKAEKTDTTSTDLPVSRYGGP